MINGQKYLVNKLKKMELLQKDLIELFMVLLNLKIQINGLIFDKTAAINILQKRTRETTTQYYYMKRKRSS